MNSMTAAGLGALVTLGLATLLTGVHASEMQASSVTRTYDLPSSRVLLLGDSIVKLNTENGALQLFRGTAGPTGSGDEWVLRVPPVKGATSGLLDVQDVRPGSMNGVFLVDVMGSRSWILKWRGNENGEWLEIKER